MTSEALGAEIGALSDRAEPTGPLVVIRRLLRQRMAPYSLSILAVILLAAVFADQVSPYDPNDGDLSTFLNGASAEHWLGTDDLGRDILSRIIHGARVSLQVGLISVSLALVVGVPVGVASGYFRRWFDSVSMRVMDALLAFPSLVLALALIAALGPGLNNAMIAIAIVYTPQYARLARGETLSIRERDYVEAARVIGSGPIRVMVRHILPNITAPLIVLTSMSVAFAILVEASLSFLGLGIQPPNASWGSMVKVGSQYLSLSAGFATFPGIAIFLTVLALSSLGDSLRDALDPRLKNR